MSTFVFSEHIRELLTMMFLSMVPTFEGRYAVTTGIAMGIPAVSAYFIALITSSIPVPIILLLLRRVLDWFYTLPIKFVRDFAAWLERHSEKKHAKMVARNADRSSSRVGRYLSAETLELFALYLFVALPLPGTGVWTGTAIATLLEFPRGKSAAAILLGNVTACLITTLITVGAKTVIA